jgi:enoyl-CoA hydratase/carnithine racemase
MPYTEILYEVADHVATITLNRPAKLNAWTHVMEREVQEAIAQADADEHVRVIIMTGAGRAFCAGFDVQALGSLAQGDPADAVRRLRTEWPTGLKVQGARADFQKTYSYFAAISKPIIAALNGTTVGLGLVVSLYCDMRFAAEGAFLSTAFSRRGLIAEHGIAWMLPRLVGLANACDLLFSARTIDAQEALRMGLVSRVLPAEDFVHGVRDYARELTTKVSPRSLRIMKKQIYHGLLQDLAEATDLANEEMFESLLSADFREGILHFLQKRPPAFTGK